MINAVESIWLLLASFLVLLMQAGFLLLEGGRVRTKNSINVAQKNVADLMIAWVAFFLFGFTIMYSIPMPVSGEGLPSPLHFLFQLGFCATAASIVSGGVAERLRFIPYMVLAAVIGALLYPFVGRLVWGNAFVESPVTWLADLGFVDFAGGTVVHSLGAWAALVAILMIGPRIDRFDEQGNVVPLPSNSSIMALQGTLLLCFGWIGFNAGSVSPTDPLMAEIITNTFSTAAFGAAGGAIIGAFLDRGLFHPFRTINGLLGGLVTSTATIHVMHAYEAMFFGFLGGMLATWAGHYLLVRWKLDDPVEVVATHGVAGTFGTLLFAFVAPVEMLVGQSRLLQFGVQLAGVVSVFVITCTTIYVALTLTKKFTNLRVTGEEELIGLNFTEHGESIGGDRLHRALNERLSSIGESNLSLDISSDDEHSDIAVTVNKLIERQEEARHVIAASEKKFQQFATTASDWLWEADANGRIVFLDIVTEQFRSQDYDNWKHQLITDVVSLSDSQQRILRECWTARAALGPLEAQISNTLVDAVHVEIRGTPHFNSNNEFVGYRGAMSDITKRKRAENQAMFLALHDELTGLKNRRALDEDLTAILEQAQSKLNKVAIVGVDLDGFKAVNDSYGHSAGDKLLQTVSKHLQKLIGETGNVYRVGGDEFILVLKNLPSDICVEKTRQITSKTLEQLSEPFSLQTHDVQIGASLGVAMFPDDAYSPVDLLRRADLAMYAAKYQGKNRTVWFEKQLDNEMSHRYLLETELRRAIAKEELYLLYQPLIDTKTETLEAFEALVRWRHPEKGELSPDEFIGIIEQNGLMPLLGEYVLDKACEFASGWPTINGQQMPRISVNISASHMTDENFTEAVLNTLHKHSLPAELLELEITEDAIISDHQKASGVINTLRASGIVFSIDDFGTGQTSLRYLSNFPVRTMKIDRSFVKNIGLNDRATEITRSMIEMGSRLGYSVVAEGVEDVKQLEMLKNWNCPIVQGFLFSKPVSEEDVLQMMQDEDAGGKNLKAG